MSPSFEMEFVLDGGRQVGAGRPCFIVAEISGNHNGDYEKAVALVRAAKDAGADAVKLQTYTADTLTIDCDKPPFRVTGNNAWKGRLLHELYREAYTPWEWQPPLFRLARELGLVPFSTPFDFTAADFLDEQGVFLFKIASFEMVDLDLVRYVAQKGKPIIMSTGMASEAEVEEAVNAIAGEGNRRLILLKCTSAYPAPHSEMNVRAVPLLARRFGVPAGLSDHCLGPEACLAAVALGACVIEKHITLNRAEGGVDASFSLEVPEFAAMVKSIRATEQALGSETLGPGVTEAANICFRRSVFSVADIEEGEVLTRQNLRVIRPGHGLAPRHFQELLGRRAACRIERGTPMSWTLVS